MQNDADVMGKSADSSQLVASALALARSERASDHKALLGYLWSEEFLSRLDSKSEYASTGRRLRISRVLDALAKNPAASAKGTLVALTQMGPFLDEGTRVDYLIKSCAEVRPAPPQLIKFWDAHSQHDDGYEHLTIDALVVNGSEPALQLLERKMADPSHTDEDKLFWMRSSILTHRNDAPLLRTCEQLLTSGLPAHLRPALVEVLFDYRPVEWYPPASVYKPPDRQKASPEAKAEMRRLAHRALAMPLTPAQKAAVEKVLQEIGPG